MLFRSQESGPDRFEPFVDQTRRAGTSSLAQVFTYSRHDASSGYHQCTSHSVQRDPTISIATQEEGRTNEWQDRARVSNEQENMGNRASPRQSNIPQEDVEEKSPNVRDTFY